MTHTNSRNSPLRSAIRWLRSPSTSTPRSASAPTQPGSASFLIR